MFTATADIDRSPQLPTAIDITARCEPAQGYAFYFGITSG